MRGRAVPRGCSMMSPLRREHYGRSGAAQRRYVHSEQEPADSGCSRIFQKEFMKTSLLVLLFPLLAFPQAGFWNADLSLAGAINPCVSVQGDDDYECTINKLTALQQWGSGGAGTVLVDNQIRAGVALVMFD